MTRQLLGLFGIVLAVFGLANNWAWLIWTAAAVMGASVIWRIAASRSGRAESDGSGPPES
jgi:hypothetical protein